MSVVQTADEKLRTADASHSNGWQKISNRWCQLLELLKKNLERMMPGVPVAEEKGSYWTTGYKQLSS